MQTALKNLLEIMNDKRLNNCDWDKKNLDHLKLSSTVYKNYLKKLCDYTKMPAQHSKYQPKKNKKSGKRR